MKKIDFKNNSEPYLNAENLNQMQTNMEDAINEVNNKFNYSTEERIIGINEDNKPIYKKIIQHSVPIGSSELDLSQLNIENLIDYNSICKRISGTSNVDWENPYYISESDYYRCFYRETTKTMQTRLQNTYTENIERITLKYTKTTDIVEEVTNE